MSIDLTDEFPVHPMGTHGAKVNAVLETLGFNPDRYNVLKTVLKWAVYPHPELKRADIPRNDVANQMKSFARWVGSLRKYASDFIDPNWNEPLFCAVAMACMPKEDIERVHNCMAINYAEDLIYRKAIEAVGYLKNADDMVMVAPPFAGNSPTALLLCQLVAYERCFAVAADFLQRKSARQPLSPEQIKLALSPVRRFAPLMNISGNPFGDPYRQTLAKAEQLVTAITAPDTGNVVPMFSRQRL